MKKLLKSLLAVMLISMMAISLVSCGAKPAKVADKLKDAGYTVEVVEGDEAAEGEEELGIKGITAAVSGMNLEAQDTVTIIWFDSKDNAADAETVLKALVVMMGEGYEVELDGKIVIYGTAQGVKDAKKAL